jgi:hypothetical protein
MKTLSEWLNLVTNMKCPYIQQNFDEIQLGFKDKNLSEIIQILDALELHEEEIRRHKQKIQLVLSEYLMKKYRYEKTRDQT